MYDTFPEDFKSRKSSHILDLGHKISFRVFKAIHGLIIYPPCPFVRRGDAGTANRHVAFVTK